MSSSRSITNPTANFRHNNAQQPSSPVWFFRFFVVYAVFMLVLLGLEYVDFFSHLWAPDPNWDSPIYRLAIGLVVVPAGIVISLLVLRRTHHNVTGLFLLIYTTTVMQLTLRIDTPLQVLSNFFSNGYIGLWLLPLYFPDGTTYPQRFQKWIRLHSIVTAVFFGLSALLMPTIEIQLGSAQIYSAPNPLRLPLPQSILGIAGTIQAVTWITTVLLIIPSVILRFRASRGLVRQQIKVFVWAFVILIGFFIIWLPFIQTNAELYNNQFGILTPLFIFYGAILFPVTPFAVVGYAILRHKLYDIDIIIRRTLQYGAITALLAMVYLGGVALFQTLFSAVTGEKSPLAVVISTLAIAALFTPLRKRVQVFVDRRFYRQKYDAERTLERFSETMRDEVDLDCMTIELVEAVEATMQPESVSLWLNSAKS
jgi:hypothetical protein